jgi:hypothetical protein
MKILFTCAAPNFIALRIERHRPIGLAAQRACAAGRLSRTRVRVRRIRPRRRALTGDCRSATARDAKRCRMTRARIQVARK